MKVHDEIRSLRSPVRAVIFDCDGVLVESEMLGLRSLQAALLDAGLELPVESLTRFSGRSHHETLTELERECGIPLVGRDLDERMHLHYIWLVGSIGLRQCQGIPEFIAELKVGHIPFTLASSGPRRKVLFSLRSAGLEREFPEFISGDDVARAKPAPDPYLAAAALLHVKASECLAIEDAPNGIRSAHTAGMQVVAVDNTYEEGVLAEADLVVKDVRQIPTSIFQ
jgi:beta-phosphoglucomutase-like phosphatase (HAD superfamily)